MKSLPCLKGQIHGKPNLLTDLKFVFVGGDMFPELADEFTWIVG